MAGSNQIRSEFIDFFKSKDHEFIASSPIVPIDDQTLLFANAGMNQFKDIFLGLRAADCKRAANSQKCLRVSGKHNDLEEVGKDTYHHTFVERLGNWSFDDYFKAEAIEWAWELLTKVWGIDGDRLWATVFAGDKADGIARDEEAANLWTKVTPIPAERVLAFGRKDNFWEMGATGPCGPCSEIHIDLGPERCDKKNVPGHKCRINGGCARFIELWNLVFIQYNRGEDGKLIPLKARYVDTGAGLERIVSVLQNKTSNYDTDLFMPIIDHVSELSGCKYTSKLNNTVDNAFRVIADHIRALVFSITDSANPSNEGRGYVIRRILRRACRFGRELGMHEPFMYKIVPVVADFMGDAFGEIRQRADYVAAVIKSEEESFGRTLDRGIEIFTAAAKKAQKAGDKIFSGEEAFGLYDTYGFPLDLTQLMAEERGLKVDTYKFDKLMDQQRRRARAARKSAAVSIGVSETELPPTEDLHKYKTSRCESKVLGFVDQTGYTDNGGIEAGCETGLVLDKTCFYAEAGGQVGDCGVIKSPKGTFIVQGAFKLGDCVIHKGCVEQGELKVGDTVTAVVSDDREATRKNHTATHLLQWALQQVKGKSVIQKGSLVGPDYLRFDFTCPSALTDKQLREVEKLVREKITADLPVTCVDMPKKEAKKLGAMALFGEKYGDIVRVVAIGAPNAERIEEAMSREFCGGTHVERTSVIAGFKILKEESISAGVRRITAVTGRALTDYFDTRSAIVDEIALLLKVPADGAAKRVSQLLEDNKRLLKQLKSAARQTGTDVMGQARELLEKCEKLGDACVVTGILKTASVEQAREAIDMVKKKGKSAAVVFGFADVGKATLLAGVTDDLIKKGLKAGDLIREIAPIIDGGGGGRPQMAQAGGKNPEKIEDALKKAAEIIKKKLTGS